MLVGEPPGHWPSEESGRLRRLLEAKPAHRPHLDRLPGTVEQVLVRALRMRPDDRYAGPHEFTSALAEAFQRRPRFSEPRAREIVARAAEIEATAPTMAGSLTIGGMQQLAAEAGIRPEHVAAAAREIMPALSPRPLPPAGRFTTWFTGAPGRIVVERVVDGEVDDGDYVTIVDEARMRFGNVGQASTLGRSLAWRSVIPPGQVGRNVYLTVTPTRGVTRIRLEENMASLAGGLFGGLFGGGGSAGIGIGMGVGMGALHSPLAAAAIIISAAVGTYSAARKLFGMSHRKRSAELGELADRIAHFVESGGSRPVPTDRRLS
jgi:hypothetical protein